jgi:hypothetical protein
MGENVARSELEARLRAQLSSAWREYLAASTAFHEVANDIPSGIADPDGLVRIEQAGAAMRAALERHSESLARFTAFQKHGI